MVILDTHIWFKFLNKEHLPDWEIRAIETAFQKNEICICSVTLWELSMLVKKNKINLFIDTKTWLNKSITNSRATVLPLNAEIAANSCCLPGNFNQDPMDNIIIATARYHGYPIITHDKIMLKYAEKGYLKIVKQQECS